MQNEIWKKVVGFENYSVSDHGNVRNDKNGRIKTNSATDTSEYFHTRLTNTEHSKNFSYIAL